VEAVILDYVLNFLGIVWEALPFIILGALIAGILEEMLPQQALANLLPKNAFLAILVGGVLGLIFPMCECGIVVVMRRLLRKGLPLSCCVAYMLAGPIVNLIVLGSTFVAFKDHSTQDGTSLGWPMVLLRAGLGFAVAVCSALVVHVLSTRVKTNELLTAKATGDTQQANTKPTLSLNVVETTSEPEPRKPWKQRLDNITNTALKDFIDITVFLILGSALAALVRADPALVQNLETLSQSNPVLAIPLMMLMALLLCLCSEADAFLAASFKGMSISAKLAFLVFGPMLDLKLLLMYTRVFKLKLILTIVASVTVFTLIACTLVHFVYNPPVMGQTTTMSIAK
jgi:uncharacterized membrane protein YraQ (UPF0718 family)